jgi:putative salt-induced outer membrane protein YdiY
MLSKSIVSVALLCAVFSGIGLVRLSADVVETRDGARLVGKITKIDGGVVYISTSYAGDLEVKQSEVTALATDAPVSMRLASGTRMDGVVSSSNGVLQIAGQDGTITTTVAKVSDSWPAGAKDPAVAALERHWKYEATVDVDGTSGNKSQLGTSMGFAAKLDTPEDALDFYTAYNRQVTDGSKSADQFKAGVDYSSNFGDASTWFVRDEGGYDRVMDIEFYDTAAAGLGYNIVKTDIDTLTGRIGLAYRYDGYDSPLTASVNSAAADFELAHDLKLKTWELVNRLTVVPTLADFKNVNITQDSYYQVPLTNPSWKLRIGLANTYDSLPPRGITKLDTTYYTRLILDFQ